MTVSANDRKKQSTGDAATSVFAYDFYIADQSHLKVVVSSNASPAVETTLTLTTDYTVSGVGVSTGGNVTLVDASQAWLDGDGDLLSGYKITIIGLDPLTQTADFRNQNTYFGSTHQTALDKLARIDNQQQDQIDRSVKLPDSVLQSSFNPILPTDIATAGMIVRVNDAGTGFVSGPTASDVENAQGYAEDAETAKDAAEAAQAAAEAAQAAAEAGVVLTANRAVVSNGSGVVSAATTTDTEIGYVNGVTSSIQTQLNSKTNNPMTTDGDLITQASSAPSRIAIGTANQILTSNGTSASWQGGPVDGGTVSFVVGTKGASVTVDTIWYQVVGGVMTASYAYRQTAGGTAGSGVYRWSLPSGWEFDTAKILVDTGLAAGARNNVVGTGAVCAAGNIMLDLIAYDATTFWATGITSGGGAYTIASGTGGLNNAAISYTFTINAFVVPA